MTKGSLPRRTVLGLITASGAVPLVSSATVAEVATHHDARLEALLKSQVTEPESRWRGACPDRWGLHEPGSAAAVIEDGIAAILHPESRFHHRRMVAERVRLAAEFLDRVQNEAGNVDLLTTNFNSPPDTGFVVHRVATGCLLAKRAGRQEFVDLLEGFLRNAGEAMTVGGIHTPNHRWVVCSALAQINELFPNPAGVRRIDQWLGEGIDIDAEGQYTERSTLVYNATCNRAFIVMAEKLGRPELLDPVRRNLEAMLYLLHPGDELVTEISRRQDQYRRGSVGRHWFALKYIGVKDSDGRFNGLANRHAGGFARLPALMEYPQLSEAGPSEAAVPDFYERTMAANGIARIRRGATSATIILGGDSRFLTLRRGRAIIRAVRVASAFFGKGQFVATEGRKEGGRYVMRESLAAPYYQPLEPPRRVEPADWDKLRGARRRSEVCKLEYEVSVEELPAGFDVRIRAWKTNHVPLAIEVNLDGDGTLTGCSEAPAGARSLLMDAERVTYTDGADTIRFGPRLREHSYTAVRGAEPKLPGRSIYLTGYTPVDHTIQFRWA